MTRKIAQRQGLAFSLLNRLSMFFKLRVFLFISTNDLLIKPREEQISTNDTITSTISPIIFQLLLLSHTEDSTI